MGWPDNWTKPIYRKRSGAFRWWVNPFTRKAGGSIKIGPVSATGTGRVYLFGAKVWPPRRRTR